MKFVSERYPDLHIPTIGVRFRDGAAEVTTRGAVAYLMSPWMRRRGIRPADEIEQAEPASRPAPGSEAELAPAAMEDTTEPASESAEDQAATVRQDGDGQLADATTSELVALGGGWFEVRVGEQVAKVRGEQAARQRLAELSQTTDPEG